jgi:hypothetical protein
LWAAAAVEEDLRGKIGANDGCAFQTVIKSISLMGVYYRIKTVKI